MHAAMPGDEIVGVDVSKGRNRMRSLSSMGPQGHDVIVTLGCQQPTGTPMGS